MTSPKKYSHIFFDLDHTLWDFETNNRLTFDEILLKLGLFEKIIPSLDAFMETYDVHNKRLWALYKEGLIEKSILSYHRFELTLQNFGVSDIDLAKEIAAAYIELSPTKTKLIPGSLEVLDYLKSKYHLGLITNGFNEIQYRKIDNAGLGQYFEWIITSEEAGCKKPDPSIFYYALQKTGASAVSSLYIGDEPETDIPGALFAGIDQILLCNHCPEHDIKATYTIHDLRELMNIL